MEKAWALQAKLPAEDQATPGREGYPNHSRVTLQQGPASRTVVLALRSLEAFLKSQIHESKEKLEATREGVRDLCLRPGAWVKGAAESELFWAGLLARRSIKPVLRRALVKGRWVLCPGTQGQIQQDVLPVVLPQYPFEYSHNLEWQKPCTQL